MKIPRLIKRFGPFLDPFLVLGIFVLFLVPILTISNLKPSYLKPDNRSNVLGATTNDALIVEPNLLDREGIFITNFHQTTASSYALEIQIAAHTEGEYQNALFTVHNTSEIEKQVNITPEFENIPQDTKISILVNSVKFIILDSDGTTYPPTLYIQPGDRVDAYVRIESDINVNYLSGFTVNLVVQ